MICRTCLRRGAAFSPSSATSATSAAARSWPHAPGRGALQSLPPRARFLSSTSSDSAPPAATTTPSSPSGSGPKLEPLIGGAAGAPGPDASAAPAKALSSCPAGTVLKGLNYFKGKTDPVALPDDEYPAWLWTCLEVMHKSSEVAGEDTGQFSKSKKHRRAAAKRQRELEAKMLAEGNIESLIPKVPLHEQTINLPGSEDGSVADNLYAVEERERLRRAMRKDRKAKIKESNYLKKL